MPSVSNEGEKEEESRQELGPADHAGHCLGMDWVRSKEQGGREGSRGARQEGEEEGVKEVSDKGMEEQVGQVELEGGAWGEQPVQLEGEGGERPVGLVGASVREWNAPEVRGEQGGDGGRAGHQGV